MHALFVIFYGFLIGYIFRISAKGAVSMAPNHKILISIGAYILVTLLICITVCVTVYYVSALHDDAGFTTWFVNPIVKFVSLILLK